MFLYGDSCVSLKKSYYVRVCVPPQLTINEDVFVKHTDTALAVGRRWASLRWLQLDIRQNRFDAHFSGTHAKLDGIKGFKAGVEKHNEVSK